MLLRTEKKLRLRWWTWFLMGNILLFWLIGLHYFPTIPWLHSEYLTFRGKALLSLFLMSSYTGHLSILALLSALLSLPILFFRVRLFFILSTLVMSLAATWLLLDTFVYGFYRFHLNGIILNFALHGLKAHVFDFSKREILVGMSIISVIIAMEWVYGYWLWQRRQHTLFAKTRWQWGTLFICFALYLSYAMISYSANAQINRVFIDSARFLPIRLFLPSKEGRQIFERAGENHTIQAEKQNAPLHYPLHALQFSKKTEPLNLVIIAIDTWRFDMLNSEVTPHIQQFAEKAWMFNQHMSGGNSTGPGFFSLFYGIPATYWTAMEKQHRGPLLLETLMDRHYQMGIFSSAQLTTPPLDRTVFQAIPDLDAKEQLGHTWREKDHAVTQKFKHFIQQAQAHSQPFFSFLVYKAAHAYCFEEESIGPFQPVIQKCNRLNLNQNNFSYYMNRYKNALFKIDQEIQEVITTLNNHQLLNNTVIILTGDHGEEFDDNHLGYWGHGSNFTRYQIQVPFVLYWPQEKPRTFTHLSSHFDVAPTLMSRLLDVSSPAADYSVGTSLTDQSIRPFLILNSYIHFGILESDKITTIYPSGHGEVTQLNGQKKEGLELNPVTLAQALQTLRRF